MTRRVNDGEEVHLKVAKELVEIFIAIVISQIIFEKVSHLLTVSVIEPDILTHSKQDVQGNCRAMIRLGYEI